jgi:hypothetical protein
VRSLPTQGRFILLAASIAALAFLLGACGRDEQGVSSLTTPMGPGHRGLRPNIAAGCPTLEQNTLNAASDFVTEVGAVAKFDSRRIRIETTGDITDPGIALLGPCVAADVPSVRVVSGHANVFVAGTNHSLTTTGSRLTFGSMAFPGQLTEPGVVLAQDAQGNLLEIIWPDLAGAGAGPPMVRLQLARWNVAQANSAGKLDVTWDLELVQDGVHQFVKGHCEGMATDGTPVVSGNAAIPPCPASFSGGGSVAPINAEIVQFRPGKRLRIEVTGDLGTGALNSSGSCSASESPSIQFTGGSANAFQAGTNKSVTATGSALTFGSLLFPGVLLEPGVVVGQDAAGNVLELIWPQLAGNPPGPPVMRFQLAQWNSWVQAGRSIDVSLQFNAVGPDGHNATIRATARNILVPVAK